MPKGEPRASAGLRAFFWPALVALAVASGIAGTTVVACRDSAPGGDSSGTPPTALAAEPLPASAVNPALVAFLSKARAAHHRADLAENESNRTSAIRALTGVVTGAIPERTPEVREVLADTYARLADLESQEGDFEGALEDIEDGLELVPDVTYFRGHLFEIRGLVEERHAKKLKEKGEAAPAKAAEDRAKAALDEAIDIQEQVIDKALAAMAASSSSAGPGPSAAPSTPRR